MVHPGLPLKLRLRSESGTIPESFARMARCAVPTLTGAPPNAFDRRTRRRRPPMLVRTIMRTVWLLNPRAAISCGVVAGAVGESAGAAAGRAGACRTSVWDVAQVATQRSWPLG